MSPVGPLNNTWVIKRLATLLPGIPGLFFQTGCCFYWRAGRWVSAGMFVACPSSSPYLCYLQHLVSSLQGYIYFSQQNDTRIIHSLVGLVVLFDFSHQALISHTVYYYLILNYANPSALVFVVWSFVAQVFLNGIIAFCVQGFLTWRIWRLSSNIWVTSIVVSLVLAEFGCVVAFGIVGLVRMSTFAELAADLRTLLIAANALAAAGDVLIASISAILLQKSKTGFQRHAYIFAPILAAPSTFIYIPFFFCMGRLYTNSLLATLNARKMIRNAGDNAQITSGQNFTFSFTSFKKPASLVSYSSKKQPGEMSIQFDTRGRRVQDRSGCRTLSKQEEKYELENLSAGNLSNGDIELTAGIPTLPNDAQFSAVTV
ncbi:hypothetical protein F5877DRAFT_85363 [Lentinula edodes]|nr:hypothetical protein F5877DRAFT_85363 [Lentinula edodes]